MNKMVRRAGTILLDADDATQKLLRPYADSAIVAALHPISKLADQPQLRLLAGGLVLAGLLGRNRRLVNAGSRMILAHEAAAFAKDLIKTEIDRTRPRSASSRQDKKPKKGDSEATELSSFPSGHSAGVIAVARAFSREYPQHQAAALGAATALAMLQIVRCAHYPTDVAVGLGLGLAVEKATDVAWSATVGSDSEQQQDG